MEIWSAVNMINNEIIESYLYCKYKAYRKLNNEYGIKTEYEELERNELLELKKRYYTQLKEKYGENSLFNDYRFGKKSRVSRYDFLVEPYLKTDQFQISFDAIEKLNDEKFPSKNSHIPIIIIPKEKISKRDKISLCVRCIILSELFGVNYLHGRIVYGPNLSSTKFKIEPFLTEAKRILVELQKISRGESTPLIFHKNHI